VSLETSLLRTYMQCFHTYTLLSTLQKFQWRDIYIFLCLSGLL
jgi:hypothetical protein